MRFKVRFQELDQTLKVNMSEENMEFGAALKDVLTVPTESDHSKLSNRDAPKQHPIGAISELTEELEARPEGTVITNEEIDRLWKSVIGG